MAHINSISSGTFTSLAYVASSTRPADAAAWLTAFNAGDATGAATITSVSWAVSGTTLTGTVAGTSLTGLTLEAGRTYRVQGTGNTTGVYFGAEAFTATSATAGTIVLSVPTGTTAPANITAAATLTFADGAGTVGQVREFPSLGTPANIVNVPVYGSSISSQVGGQADAPTLTFTLNYIPTEHAALDTIRQTGVVQAFRVRLASSANGVRGNSFDIFDDLYFRGRIESFETTPSLSDSNQVTVTMSIQGDFAGPFSLVGTTYALPT